MRRWWLPVLAALTVAFASGDFLAPSGASAQVTPQVWIEPQALSLPYQQGVASAEVWLRDLYHRGEIRYRDGRVVPSVGLGGFELRFTFDPRLIEVVGAVPGDFLGRSGRPTQCFEQRPSPNTYVFGCVTSGTGPGPVGRGLLATVTLRPVANGRSFLGLAAALAGPWGDSISVDVRSALVQVFGAPQAMDEITPPADGPGGSPADRTSGAPTPVGGTLAPDGTGTDAAPNNGATFPRAGGGFAHPDQRNTLAGVLAALGAAALLGAIWRWRPRTG